MKRLLPALLVPVLALAHGVAHPRQLTLEATAGRLVVTVTLELARTEADGARRMFDRDRDGALSEAEGRLLATFLERRAMGELAVTREGRAVALRRVSAETLRLGERTQSVEIRVVSDLSWDGAEADLELVDGGDAEGHVPVVLRSKGVRATLDAPRIDERHDLPAHRPSRLRIRAE